MIESSFAFVSFWLTGRTLNIEHWYGEDHHHMGNNYNHHPHNHNHLITTLMLSPSTPPDSLPDSPMSLRIDFAKDPALPGLRIGFIVLMALVFSTVRTKDIMVSYDFGDNSLSGSWFCHGWCLLSLLVDLVDEPPLPGLMINSQ